MGFYLLATTATVSRAALCGWARMLSCSPKTGLTSLWGFYLRYSLSIDRPTITSLVITSTLPSPLQTFLKDINAEEVFIPMCSWTLSPPHHAAKTLDLDRNLK